MRKFITLMISVSACVVLVSSTEASYAIQMNTIPYRTSDSTRAAMMMVVQDDTLQTQQRIYKGHTGRVNQIVFAPDGKTFASESLDGTLRTWNVDTGASTVLFTGMLSTKSATNLQFTQNGSKVVFWDGVDSIRFLDALTGQTKNTIKLAPQKNGKPPEVHRLSFSSDSKRMLVGTKSVIQIWDVGTNSMLSQFPEKERDSQTHIDSALSSDGTVVAYILRSLTIIIGPGEYGRDDPKNYSITAEIYRERDGKWRGVNMFTPQVASWSTSNSSLAFYRIRFTPDSKKLAISGDDVVAVYDWRASTGILARGDREITTINFSNDSKLLISCGKSSKVYITSISEKPAQIALLNTNSRIASGCLLSPDGNNAITYGEESLEFWDVIEKRGQKLKLDNATQTKFSTAILSPDGRLIFAGLANGNIISWTIK